MLQKKVDKIQTKKVQDKFEKKVLPTKYEKQTLQTDVVKGKVHKEIVRTSVIKGVVRSSVHPEVVRSSVLRTIIRNGSGVASGEGVGLLTTTTINQTVDLGTTVLFILLYLKDYIETFINLPALALFFINFIFFIGKEVSISCLELDKNFHHIFIGDMLGNINCNDISSIYEIMEEKTTKEEVRNFENETIIIKENIYSFNDINIKLLWSVEAHK